MNLRATTLTLLALALVAALVFHFFQRQLAGAWFAFGVHPDVLVSLEQSLEDQKRLARLEPERALEHRAKFEATQALLSRLRILDYNRREIVRRYELALLAGFAVVLGLAAAVHLWSGARLGTRLGRLRVALGELAGGRTDVVVADRGRDAVGRIAAMVEETSRVMTRDRRRLASLENLSAWQEAARRHAHEVRTPLTAARLELGRLRAAIEAMGRATGELGVERLDESAGTSQKVSGAGPRKDAGWGEDDESARVDQAAPAGEATQEPVLEPPAEAASRTTPAGPVTLPHPESFRASAGDATGSPSSDESAGTSPKVSGAGARKDAGWGEDVGPARVDQAAPAGEATQASAPATPAHGASRLTPAGPVGLPHPESFRASAGDATGSPSSDESAGTFPKVSGAGARKDAGWGEDDGAARVDQAAPAGGATRAPVLASPAEAAFRTTPAGPIALPHPESFRAPAGDTPGGLNTESKRAAQVLALAQVAESVEQEFDRLARFTEGFTSFARLPAPRPRREDLASLVEEFVRLFATAWPNLALRCQLGGSFPVDVDRDMLRQVLVNLCDNSSLAAAAGGERRGAVTFALYGGAEGTYLEVADDGPGIAAEVRSRLFEPYTTTRGIGEGMGLGLAISRKVLLDHGGDLELLASSSAGATFRLLFPREAGA